MESSLMIPAKKSGSGITQTKSSQKEINSFSQIEVNANSELKGRKMRTLGYDIDVKKIIKNL